MEESEWDFCLDEPPDDLLNILLEESEWDFCPDEPSDDPLNILLEESEWDFCPDEPPDDPLNILLEESEWDFCPDEPPDDPLDILLDESEWDLCPDEPPDDPLDILIEENRWECCRAIQVNDVLDILLVESRWGLCTDEPPDDVHDILLEEGQLECCSAIQVGVVLDIKPKKRQKRFRKQNGNKLCDEEKDIDRFGKSDVKRRGKIPNWQEVVFRKNYLLIMENIRVDEIMDHLYSEKVIDLVEMDKMVSKLKSEGNRDALRYLMYTLFNSSHIALPTFIQCLHQTGYHQLAEHLQNDMNSIKPSVSNCSETDASYNLRSKKGKLY